MVRTWHKVSLDTEPPGQEERSHEVDVLGAAGAELDRVLELLQVRLAITLTVARRMVTASPPTSAAGWNRGVSNSVVAVRTSRLTAPSPESTSATSPDSNEAFRRIPLIERLAPAGRRCEVERADDRVRERGARRLRDVAVVCQQADRVHCELD